VFEIILGALLLALTDSRASFSQYVILSHFSRVILCFSGFVMQCDKKNVIEYCFPEFFF